MNATISATTTRARARLAIPDYVSTAAHWLSSAAIAATTRPRGRSCASSVDRTTRVHAYVVWERCVRSARVWILHVSTVWNLKASLQTFEVMAIVNM